MKIIAVDDEKLALEGMSRALKEVAPDSALHCFRDPSEAFKDAQSFFPDIAFLDIEMNQENGINFASALKKINPKINIIFVTGYEQYMADAFAMHASGYILKPFAVKKVKQELDSLRFPCSQEKRIQTFEFGSFSVLGDGKAVKFKYQKTKELLAVLIDACGKPCSNQDILFKLWDSDDETKKAYLRNIISDLKRIFAFYGCEDAIERRRNFIKLDKDRISSQYFDFLNKVPGASENFKNEYMSQYSWAEPTLGFLLRNKNQY